MTATPYSTPQMITYEEALQRCTPGGGEDGYCIACKVYAPSLPFGSEDEAICYACALRLAPAHPRLARALERPLRTTLATVAL